MRRPETMTEPGDYMMQPMSSMDFYIMSVEGGRQITPSIKREYMDSNRQLKKFLEQFREVEGDSKQELIRNNTRIVVWARDSESNMLIKVGGNPGKTQGFTAGYLHDMIKKEGTKFLERTNPTGEATFDRYMLDIYHTEISKSRSRRRK
jgi:hypothetical protein